MKEVWVFWNVRMSKRYYYVELVARKTFVTMYKSKKCETREQAEALTRRYLARNTHLKLESTF